MRSIQINKYSGESEEPIISNEVSVICPSLNSEGTKSRTQTNQVRKLQLPSRYQKPRRFVHYSDELIARLIESKPGSTIVGKIDFKRYEQVFKDSLASPIRLSDSDNEYDKELKLQVIAARKEIVKLCSDGSSFSSVMETTRTELQRLGQYRSGMIKELRSLKNDKTITDDDYSDFLKAANKLLEEKGAEPIQSPGLVFRNFSFNNNQQ